MCLIIFATPKETKARLFYMHMYLIIMKLLSQIQSIIWMFHCGPKEMYTISVLVYLLANIEIFHCVECIIIRGRTRDAVPPNQCT